MYSDCTSRFKDSVDIRLCWGLQFKHLNWMKTLDVRCIRIVRYVQEYRNASIYDETKCRILYQNTEIVVIEIKDV